MDSIKARGDKEQSKDKPTISVKTKKTWRERMKETKMKKKEMIIPDDGVPYDRGWAWMICFSGFINMAIFAGYNRSTFVFFVNFLEEFDAPVSQTALLFGVKAAVNSVVGLFIMNAVLGKFGTRKTVMVGGVCLALSAILGSLAYDVTSLIVSQAVFHGLGMSMMNMPCTVLAGFYFRRRRSLANSIIKCGVGVGAVAFPPVVTFFLSQYGLRGSLLITGGVCLHSVVAAMLLRPVSFYQKLERKKQLEQSLRSSVEGGEEDGKMMKETSGRERERDEDQDKTSDGSIEIDPLLEVSDLTSQNHNPEKNASAQSLTNDRSVLSDCNYHDDQINAETQARVSLDYAVKSAHFMKKVKNVQNANNSNGMASNSRSSCGPETIDLSPLGQCTEEQESALSSKERSTSGCCCGRACPMLRRLLCVLDFSLFRSPMFRLLVVFFITSPLINSVPTYLPAMCKERGMNENERALLLSVIGGLDFFSRLGCGFIADLRIFKVSTMIGISFAVVGGACQLTSLLTTFPLMVGFVALQGLLGGVAACLLPVLIMEDIGLQHTAKALGFFKLFSGGSMAAFHPLLGYIRDVTGTYDAAYNLIGAVTLVSAVVIMSLRFFPHTLCVPSDDQLDPEAVAPLASPVQLSSASPDKPQSEPNGVNGWKPFPVPDTETKSEFPVVVEKQEANR